MIAVPHADRRIDIVPMRRRHLRAVLAIEERAYPRPWSRAIFERELAQTADGTHDYVVARAGRRIIGYAGIWLVPDPDGAQVHLTNIVVAEDWRRRGVARRLLVHLADRAIAEGGVAWTLEVRASASGAQALYRRFGFAPAGVRRRYYENTEDAIVMWCHDLDGDAYRARLEVLRDGDATVSAGGTR